MLDCKMPSLLLAQNANFMTQKLLVLHQPHYEELASNAKPAFRGFKKVTHPGAAERNRIILESKDDNKDLMLGRLAEAHVYLTPAPPVGHEVVTSNWAAKARFRHFLSRVRNAKPRSPISKEGYVTYPWQLGKELMLWSASPSQNVQQHAPLKMRSTLMSRCPSFSFAPTCNLGSLTVMSRQMNITEEP
jgi:hypothetical protein